eukprot:scaffold14370_cov72-Phaeocystis_antarctica.AAC.3
MSSSDESHGFGQLGHGSLHELGTATLTENCDPRDLLLWGGKESLQMLKVQPPVFSLLLRLVATHESARAHLELEDVAPHAAELA